MGSDGKLSPSPPLLYTEGELFSLHNSGHMYNSTSNQLVAYWTNRYWTMTETWEMYSYSSSCKTALPGAQKEGNHLVYPFARMTKHFWTLYSHYTVQRYEC